MVKRQSALLFGYWNGDISQAMLDDLTWLYLEHVLYTEEALKRPSMTDLRVYYGKAFLQVNISCRGRSG